VEEAPVSEPQFDQIVLRQIENTVTDLRQADTGGFDRHIKKLSRLLHAPELERFTSELVKDIDLDAWIQVGYATQGSMIGGARLEWPAKRETEMGTIVLLIDRFSEDPRQAVNFAGTFYYNGTTNIPSTLRHMTQQLFVPFARDYITYVEERAGVSEAGVLQVRSAPATRKAFLVHGHDEGAREAVARFLERIGFEPIILHEQASQGRTIIEKIEAHGDVGFAVVLLTPDDVGSVKDGVPQPRARQNVLLELGYFIGRLGRSHVCALKRGKMELPSDFGGVVYEPLDDLGGWKTALGRELRAAGFEIDWNKVHE
jgi:CAP12/Pycsar effector protein, TIR domain